MTDVERINLHDKLFTLKPIDDVLLYCLLKYVPSFGRELLKDLTSERRLNLTNFYNVECNYYEEINDCITIFYGVIKVKTKLQGFILYKYKTENQYSINPISFKNLFKNKLNNLDIVYVVTLCERNINIFEDSIDYSGFKADNIVFKCINLMNDGYRFGNLLYDLNNIDYNSIRTVYIWNAIDSLKYKTLTDKDYGIINRLFEKDNTNTNNVEITTQKESDNKMNDIKFSDIKDSYLKFNIKRIHSYDTILLHEMFSDKSFDVLFLQAITGLDKLTFVSYNNYPIYYKEFQDFSEISVFITKCDKSNVGVIVNTCKYFSRELNYCDVDKNILGKIQSCNKIFIINFISGDYYDYVINPFDIKLLQSYKGELIVKDYDCNKRSGYFEESIVNDFVRKTLYNMETKFLMDMIKSIRKNGVSDKTFGVFKIAYKKAYGYYNNKVDNDNQNKTPKQVFDDTDDIDKIKRKYEESLADIERSNNSLLLSIDNTHKEVIKSIKDNHNSQIKELNKHIIELQNDLSMTEEKLIKLSEEYDKLKDEYDDLKGLYNLLVEENNSLIENYNNLVSIDVAKKKKKKQNKKKKNKKKKDNK